MPQGQHDEDRGHERRAVVVDDRAEALELLQEILALEHGMRVVPRLSATVDDLAESEPDLLVLDLWVGPSDRANGWSLACAARTDARLQDVGIVLTSADRQSLDRYAERARREDVVLLPKPFALDDLHDAVTRALAPRGDGSPVSRVAHGP